MTTDERRTTTANSRLPQWVDVPTWNFVLLSTFVNSTEPPQNRQLFIPQPLAEIGMNNITTIK